MPERKKVVLLGATGSIGRNALRIIEKHSDKLELIGVAANSNADKLAEIIKKFNTPHASIFENSAFNKLKTHSLKNCDITSGVEGLNTLAALPEADLVVIAVVGAIGIYPTLSAINAGNTIAIANKEPLVMAGQFIMDAARKHGVQILPMDSEHNSIFQCIENTPKNHISEINLTASGGMFRDYTDEQLDTITPEQAKKHPNWDMGAKITVDTATLINKGLELIEAKWLFDLDPSQLNAVIHRQSIIHSLITLVDGCILCQLNPPSMTFAIQHCLLYPNRAPGVDKTLDLTQLINLNLEPVDLKRYPGFHLAKESLKAGGTRPAIFNAANEVAVEAFLKGQLPFKKIPEIIEDALATINLTKANTLEEIIAADQSARQLARKLTLQSENLITTA